MTPKLFRLSQLHFTYFVWNLLWVKWRVVLFVFISWWSRRGTSLITIKSSWECFTSLVFLCKKIKNKMCVCVRITHLQFYQSTSLHVKSKQWYATITGDYPSICFWQSTKLLKRQLNKRAPGKPTPGQSHTRQQAMRDLVRTNETKFEVDRIRIWRR